MRKQTKVKALPPQQAPTAPGGPLYGEVVDGPPQKYAVMVMTMLEKPEPARKRRTTKKQK